MGHPLRLYEPNRVYELTVRTIQGRFLLVPSKEANDLIAGVIGRAQEQFQSLKLHGVVFLSNHSTWLVSSPNPEEIPRFIGFVNGNISKELGRLHDWPGKLWGRPQKPIPVLDNPSMVERMKHLLAQGCKENLVISPRDWPGVTCVHALLGGKPVRGTWVCRDEQTKARRRKAKSESDDEFATAYELRFAKLPCWAHLADEEYANRVACLIEEIEADAACARAREKKKGVVGVRRICRVHPHYRPETLAESPAPLCHASSAWVRKAYRISYRALVDGFRRAAERLKRGLDAQFPKYCFPPRLPFVT